jgi:anti-sigma factor RsiW
MNQNHPLRKELFLYIDGELSPEEQLRVEKHLATCPSCVSLAAGIERLGKRIGSIPIEETSAGFTATVLHELGLISSPGRRTRMLESAGALVAMVVVAGVLLSVFLATGVLKEEQVSDTRSAAGMVLDKGGNAVAAAVDGVTKAMTSYLSFDFGKNALDISLSALVVLALLAIVDRFAGRKVLHRTE